MDQMVDHSLCIFCLINKTLPTIYMGYVMMYFVIGIIFAVTPQVRRGGGFKPISLYCLYGLLAFLIVLLIRDFNIDWRYVPLSIIQTSVGFAVGASLRGYLRIATS